ncbi:MAG: porin family protein, partial [Hydrogenophaga sp.]
MKKLRLHPVAIAATTLLALGAQAQSLYGEVGYGQLKLQEDRFGSEVDPGMARGIIGYTLSPNLAVEGHL